jgi:hypothetical protein
MYYFQKTLLLWNTGLAVFSMFGFYYVLMEFIEVYKKYGFDGRQEYIHIANAVLLIVGTYCKAGNFFQGKTGYWVWLFTVSKVMCYLHKKTSDANKVRF